MDALKKIGVSATMIKGSGGIFTVAVDGTIVAQKTGGVFPSEDEIVAKVSAAL